MLQTRPPGFAGVHLGRLILEGIIQLLAVRLCWEAGYHVILLLLLSNVFPLPHLPAGNTLSREAVTLQTHAYGH